MSNVITDSAFYLAQSTILKKCSMHSSDWFMLGFKSEKTPLLCEMRNLVVAASSSHEDDAVFCWGVRKCSCRASFTV